MNRYLTDALEQLARGEHVSDERDLFKACADRIRKDAARIDDLVVALGRRDGLNPAEARTRYQGMPPAGGW